MTTTPAGNIQEKIEEELENARTVCDVSGNTSGECAAAWDAVEELQAEASHQKQVKPKNSFEKYCDDNPDAAECRIYDEWSSNSELELKGEGKFCPLSSFFCTFKQCSLHLLQVKQQQEHEKMSQLLIFGLFCSKIFHK